MNLNNFFLKNENHIVKNYRKINIIFKSDMIIRWKLNNLLSFITYILFLLAKTIYYIKLFGWKKKAKFSLFICLLREKKEIMNRIIFNNKRRFVHYWYLQFWRPFYNRRDGCHIICVSWSVILPYWLKYLFL